MIRAVQTVAAGDAWLDPAVTGRVRAATRPRRRRAAGADARGAHGRELDVLRLLAPRRSNTEIAGDLSVPRSR